MGPIVRLFDEWLLLPERIALHEPTATAVLADVHLGYTAARQQLGDAIPWRSVEEELQPLSKAVATHAIRQLLIAGDLFERGFDRGLYQAFLDVAARLDLHWLGLAPGNHDRGVLSAGAVLPLFAEGYDLLGWHITHGDQTSGATRAVQGHWHPALRRQGRKLPCFLVRASQIILPAFSLDAAGVDVGLDSRWQDWQRYVIIDQQVMLAHGPSRAGGQAKTRGQRRGF